MEFGYHMLEVALLLEDVIDECFITFGRIRSIQIYSILKNGEFYMR